jgi:circadian clock protein KaiB
MKTSARNSEIVKRHVRTARTAATSNLLRLYVAGQTPKSLAALNNLKKICKNCIGSSCRIEVVDLLANPKLARRDQIIAIPTLVRHVPSPARKIIGDLSDAERVLLSLDLRSAK